MAVQLVLDRWRFRSFSLGPRFLALVKGFFEFADDPLTPRASLERSSSSRD